MGYDPQIMGVENVARQGAGPREGVSRSVLVISTMMVRRWFLAFFGVCRNDEQFAVAHPALGDQMSPEMFDFVTRSAQERDFKA